MAINYSINGTSFDQYYMPQSYLNQFVLTGSLWGWGDNSWGILGNNSTISRSSPVQTIAAGTNWLNAGNALRHTACIKTDGTLWSWGDNTYGQLGSNTITSRSSPVSLVGTGSTSWRVVTTGYNFTTAIKQNGNLWTWGRNNYGQLGTNTTIDRSSPVQTAAGGVNWITCTSGKYSASAITSDGTLWTWGRNNYGQLGLNSASGQIAPNQVGVFKWTQFSMNQRHAGGVKSDGRLWMWGSNYWGQLGTGNQNTYYSPVQTIAGGTNWSYVAIGANNTAGVKTDGTLWTWGNAYFSQLGNGAQPFSNVKVSSPVQTAIGGTNWSKVAAGGFPNGAHMLAIKTDGTLWGWGSNSYGELGTGDNTLASTPVQTIAGGTNWSQVACGWGNSAAIKTDGTLWTWGSNYSYAFSTGSGKLGDGTTINRNSPVQTASGGTNWSSVTTGQKGDFTTAIKTDGTLWTWGLNNSGQLGTNNIIKRSSPDQTIAGGSTWYKVSAGGYGCIASQTDGTLWGWGSNGSGQLGNSSTISRSSPVQTGLPGNSAGTDWLGILPNQLGFEAAGALKADGSLWLWGGNGYAQLGPITTQSGPVTTAVGTSYPIQAPADTSKNWQQVSMGAMGNHIAAITSDGRLWTWGLNNYGQLGDNTTINKSSPIQTIAGGTNWGQVSAGALTTGSTKLDGTLWTWGCNSTGTQTGALGDNTTTSKSSPVQTVAGGTNWKQVSMGSSFSSGIKTNGTLWTWGYNFKGQLGDNTTINKSSPIQTTNGGSNWKSVTAGDNIMQGIYFYDAYNLYPS